MTQPDLNEAEAHVEQLYRDLVNAIAQGKSLDVANQEIERIQRAQFQRYPELLGPRLTALARARQRLLDNQNRVNYLQRSALRFGREEWYLGPKSGSAWENLVGLLTSRNRSADEIQTVDDDSTAVVGLLDNPAKAEFTTKGLVVGHVQSGKTGNMAAVINKAADTQYKFFLVLSGITDQLRNQTQTRMDSDVVGLAPDRWMTWTSQNTETLNGDFAHTAIGGFSFDQRNQIAVVKKNGGILRRILAKLRNTDRATLLATPFLIIDDECDQASVNSARYANAVTRINDLLRQIIGVLPRVAYVGYTATPFANVLIDTTVPEDLYPRDFIYGLKRPKAYFGAEELFGRQALEGEYTEQGDGFDMIRVIPEEEIPALRPPRNAEISLNDSLAEAIRYFLLVVAARRVRGDVEKHNTMLIHTSMLNSVHRRTAGAVGPYVEWLKDHIQRGDTVLLDDLAREWDAEQSRVLSEQFDRAPVLFSQVRPHLADVMDEMKVHVENWSATERLDYSAGPKTYLVIGGNVLARGLTLEGLSVSYFLRSSSQYDTLMQMGRWFGYRPGFEDLPRIWVEERVREAFFDLATVEAEIRRDIDRYAIDNLRPDQFAVRIRRIPGMAITAPAKMRHAVDVKIGYGETHIQTTRFHRRDAGKLDANWKAGSSLIDASGASAPGRGNARIFTGIGVDAVETFLSEYEPHQTHRNLDRKLLKGYIRQAAAKDARMETWNVVVMTGTGARSSAPLGALGIVNTIVRSAEINSGEDASIKALMSRKDIALDLSAEPGGNLTWEGIKAMREAENAGPLLLLYPIEARSKPQDPNSKTREPLAAASDVLGYGIVFPKDGEPGGTYVAANIQPDAAEPADDVGAEDRIPTSVLSDGAAGEAAA